MIEAQRRLLADSVRNQAFAAAIAAVVRPGMRVADLGAGTGFLSLLAAQHGASVTAYEQHPGLVGLARDILRANRAAKAKPAIRLVTSFSYAVADPEPADVVIAEVLGNYCLEEHLIETMGDGRRFLRKGGVMLPSAVRLFVCPVVAAATQRSVDTWQVGFGLDYAAARRVGLSNLFVRTVPAGDLLQAGAAARIHDSAVFPGDGSSRRTGSVEFTLSSAATIHGLACWWEADLAPGITLSTSPLAPPTHWEQIYLPLLKPVAAKRGDTFAVTIASDTRLESGCVLAWDIGHRRGGKVLDRQKMDNLAGFLG